MSLKKTTYIQNYLVAFVWVFIAVNLSSGQTKEQRSKIIQNYDQAQLKHLIARFKEDRFIKKQQFKNMLLEKRLGVLEKQNNGSYMALNDIGIDGTPLYYTTFSHSSSAFTRANALHEGASLNLNLSGDSLIIGVWDAGIARDTHQEFKDRVTNADGGEINNHGTLVTGVLVSSGVHSLAKGVAYNAKVSGYDWFRDKIEVTEAAANGLLLSNHSYGIKTDKIPDWYFGAYTQTSKDWDDIMYHAPFYLMVSAAGNSQKSLDNALPNFGRTRDGFDLLLGFSTSKNGLVVAAAHANIDDYDNLKSAAITPYSSFGPTDDGRIKPDIAGIGFPVLSTSSNNDMSYKSTMGTSMAAPSVSGSLLLLQEYHESIYGYFMKAATLKALALHTADDVQESGPDYQMGWGILNAKRAAETIQTKDFSVYIAEKELTDNETYSMTVKANDKESLSVSISWTDPALDIVNKGDLNSGLKALTNDLDVRIKKDEVTYFPWRLDPAQASSPAQKGDNSVDNYERINIDNATGTYTITVSHKGTLLNGSQNFSIIVSGVELTSCKLEIPTDIDIKDRSDNISLEWSDLGSETRYNFQLKALDENREAAWQSYTTAEHSFPLNTLNWGTRYIARIRSVCTQNLSSEVSEEITSCINALKDLKFIVGDGRLP